jgi:Zn-dependent protease/CBS domain-containing protein
MRWSWKIGRVAGIDLRVHATFLLLLAWAALAYYRVEGTATAATRGVVFTLALFASVVLHELGHALTARRFGVATKDITLLPIGGVARLAYMPRKPKQELAIALMGPAVTLAVIIILFAAIQIFSLPNAALSGPLGARGGFVAELMWVNISLLAFNLLPAFPMDGGRVLRAALAIRGNYVKATETAARAGKAFALAFGILGLFYNPFLVLIALFVWLGAAGEEADARLHSTLNGVPVERVMIRDVQTLTPRDNLDVALRYVLDGFQQDFPVVEEGKVVGILTRSRLLDAVSRFGREAFVGDTMEQAFRTAVAQEPVEGALSRLHQAHCSTLPVMKGDQLEGVLTLENVGEYVMIDAALREATT